MVRDFRSAAAFGLVCSSALIAGCSSGGSSNAAPVFEQASYAFNVNEDLVLNGQVAATDADGDALSYTQASQPSNGSFSLQADGRFTYTPNNNFAGQDQVQVRVSDGAASAVVDITISVAPINDAPTIESVSVVTDLAGTSITGQVTATDPENDSLTYSIVTQPSGAEQVSIENDGSFSYAGVDADKRFTVRVSDGSLFSEQVVSLIPSYTTNAEKLAYYYASNKSHLKLAESIIEQDGAGDIIKIDDPTVATLSNQNIAIGLAKAGFFTEAQTHISTKIAQTKAQADALRKLSLEADAQGDTTLGNTLRTDAIAKLRQYIADNGLVNVASSIGGFVLGVVRSYNDNGDFAQADALLDDLKGDFDSLGAANQKTVSERRKLVVPFQEYADQTAQTYFTNQTSQNLTRARLAAERFAEIALEQGYYEHSRFGIQERYKTLEGAKAALIFARLYMVSQDATVLEAGKDHLAAVMSYFADASYDSNRQVSAKNHAANTLARYNYPLNLLAGAFAAFYPEQISVASDGQQSGNAALDVMPANARNSDGYTFATSYKAIADAKANTATLQAGIDNIELYFETNGERPDSLKQALFEYNFSFAVNYANPVWFAFYALGADEAKLMLDATADAIESSYYLDGVNGRFGNKADVDDLIESDGCTRIAQLRAQFSGQLSEGQAQMTRCQVLVDSYFSSTTPSTTSKISDANRHMARAWAVLGDNAKAGTSFDAALAAATAFNDLDDALKHLMQLANVMATSGLFTQAQQAFDAALAKANAALAQVRSDSVTGNNSPALSDDEIEVLEQVLEGLDFATEYGEEDSNYMTVLKYLAALRAQVGNAGVPAALAHAHSELLKTLDEVNALAQYTADSTKQSKLYRTNSTYRYNSEYGLVLQYALLREYDKALGLVTDGTFPDGDRDQVFAYVSRAASEQDDFVGVSVANVDTDSDGKPNFFLPNASQNDIDNSGLSIDDDDDGDGIANNIDPKPLTATDS